MNKSQCEDGKLKEYELLRQELMHYDRSVVQLLGILLGFVGVITAQGLTSGNPHIFIIPIPVLFVLSIYVSDKRWVIWLIASYVSEFIEKKGIGPQWETRLFRFRTACKEYGHFTPGQNIIKVEFFLFNFLGLLEFGLFVYFAYVKRLPLWHYVIPLVLYICLSIQTYTSYYKLMREGREGAFLQKIWLKAEGLEGETNKSVEQGDGP